MSPRSAENAISAANAFDTIDALFDADATLRPEYRRGFVLERHVAEPEPTERDLEVLNELKRSAARIQARRPTWSFRVGGDPHRRIYRLEARPPTMRPSPEVDPVMAFLMAALVGGLVSAYLSKNNDDD